MMAQEYKSRLPTPSSPCTPSRRWPPFTPGRRAGAAAGLFGIACGCVDSKAVAVSPSPVDPPTYPNSAVPGGASDSADCYTVYGDTDTLRYQRRISKSGSLSFTTATTTRSITTSSSSSNALAKSSSGVTRSSEEEPGGESSQPEPHRLSSGSGGASSSNSTFLRQLSELENSVRDWSPPLHADASDPDSDATPTSPARASTDAAWPRQGCGAASAVAGGKGSSWGRRDGRSGSVVVVTDTEDPVGEFQRSMLAMVADRGMTCADELRELLVWFLALNTPDSHGLVLLAFARVCQEVLPTRNPTKPLPVPEEPWVRRRPKQRQPTPRRRSRYSRAAHSTTAGTSYCCDR